MQGQGHAVDHIGHPQDCQDQDLVVEIEEICAHTVDHNHDRIQDLHHDHVLDVENHPDLGPENHRLLVAAAGAAAAEDYPRKKRKDEAVVAAAVNQDRL